MARPTDAQVLAALAANGGNAKKTAEILGMPRSTVRYIAGRSNSHGRTPSPLQREDQRQDLAGKWKAVADKSAALVLQGLDHVKPGELKPRDIKELVISGAVATEKHQLLTGGATQRTEQVKIALVDASALRTLAAHIVRPALPAPEVVEGQYKEQPESA